MRDIRGPKGLGQLERRSSALRHEDALRRLRLAMPIVALAAIGLSGCASISQKFAETASQMPAVGLPAGAPERPSATAAYPAVHDIPPPRNSVTLTNTEAAQLEGDLKAARDKLQSSAGTTAQPKKNQAPPPAKVVPVSSRASIY
jgi:hypothetical protein